MDPPILVGGRPHGREGSLLLAARMTEELGGSRGTKRTRPIKTDLGRVNRAQNFQERTELNAAIFLIPSS